MYNEAKIFARYAQLFMMYILCDFTQHKNTIDTQLDMAELRTTYSKD